MNAVGIDVSKNTLDLYCLDTGAGWQVENTDTGHRALVSRLAGAERVVLEATGGYEQAVLDALLAGGIPVARVNPKRVRDFARATGQLAKTDKLDARVLALFAHSMPLPQTAAVACPEQVQLKALVAERHDLVGLVTMDRNRLQQCRQPDTRVRIEVRLACLKSQLKEVEHALQTLLNQPALKEAARVLSQVVGVGLVLVATLLSQMPELGRVNRKQIAALAGIAPFNCDSGTFKGKRRIWGGRHQVRSTLYMATFVATRFNPEIKAHFEQLRARGKAFKVALVACMRKLLVQLNAKMRNHLQTLSP